MVKQFVISHSAATAVLGNGASITAPMKRGATDRGSWPALCKAVGCPAFASLREFARRRCIPVYPA